MVKLKLANCGNYYNNPQKRVKVTGKKSSIYRNVIFNIFKVAFGVIFSFILGTNLFCGDWKYTHRKNFLFSNPAILWITIVLLVAVIIWRYVKVYQLSKLTLWQKRKPFKMDKIVIVLSLALFCLQFYISYNIFFVTDWDVGVILKQVDILLNDGDKSRYLNYFSNYPNNLFITYIYYYIMKLNESWGIFTGVYASMCIVTLNCVINSFSCWLTYKTAKLFTSEKWAFGAFCMVALSCGLSSWTAVCYSDALMLFVPITAVYLYARPYKNQLFKLLGLMAAISLSIAGYFVKPQASFAGIAIIVIELFRLFDRFSLKTILRPIAIGLATLLTVVCVTGIINDNTEKLGVQIDENREFGYAHFLMMGINEEGGGAYSGPDVTFSRSFETKQERDAANMQVFKDRVKEMGFGRIFTHIQKKMLTTFNDGTFAWGREGAFLVEVPENLNDKVSPYLKSLYYDRGGERYIYLSSFQQLVWMIIMFLAFGSVFLKKAFKQKWEISVMWVILLGFVAYEMLFEVRARYFYIFAPIVCVLAIIGSKNIVEFVSDKIPFATNLLKKAIKRK